MKNKFLQLTNKDDILELYIYGDIVNFAWWEDDVDASVIRNQIQDYNGDLINVRINSYGGDVFTGIAIYNMLKNHPAKVHVYVDSCACSIASVIAMAGDKVYMPKNTLMMIHNAWTFAVGNSKELRKTAEDLDVIMNASIESYMSRIKISREELIELLDAETWLTAEECVEMGFADEIIELKEQGGAMQSATLFNLVQKVKEREAPIQETEPVVSEPIKEPLIEEEETESVEEEKTPNLVEKLLEKIGGEN